MLFMLGTVWGFRQSLKFALRNKLPLVLAVEDGDAIYVEVVSVGLFTAMVDVFDAGFDEQDEDDESTPTFSWIARVHLPLSTIRAISLDDIERGRMRIENAYTLDMAS